jgi:hypothetical protein
VGGILVFFIIMYIVWFQWVSHPLYTRQQRTDILSESADPVTTNPMMAIMQATTANSILTVLRKRNTPDSTLSTNPSHPDSQTATRVQQPVSPPIHLLILENDETGIGHGMKNTSRLGILTQERLGWEQPNLDKCGTMIDDLVISMVRSPYITRRTILLIHSIKGLKVTIDLDQYLPHHPFHPFLRSIGNRQLHLDLVPTSPTATSMVDTMKPVLDPEHNIRSILMTNLRKRQVRGWPRQTLPPCYHGSTPPNLRLCHLPQIQERRQVGRSRMVSAPNRRCR